MEVVFKKRKIEYDNCSNKKCKNFTPEVFIACDNNIIPEKKEIQIKTKDCLICMSEINENEIITLHKDHFYMCQECLVNQGQVLLRNRDLLPWKCPCCQEEIALDTIQSVMSNEDYNKLLSRQMETIIGETVSCYECDVSYCLPFDFNENSIECYICNSTIQINEKETVNADEINNLLSLAGQENWAQCPGCHELIEKIDGCNSMTHHENNRSVTHFCYQCNEILDSNDVDTIGRPHFPNGSYNDCINTSNNILDDFYVVPDSIDNNIDYENFNWDNENDSIASDEMYYCTECDYSGFNQYSLDQHINAKGHYER